MTEEAREMAAAKCERIAEELEAAAAHARVAARHFRDREVPRDAAHAFAAQGHANAAQAMLDELAVLHAARSRPE